MQIAAPHFPISCQPPRPVKVRCPLALIAFLLLLCGRLPAAIQVGSPVWGFDGKVLPDTFNVVSVEISNPSAKPFEGDFVLDDAPGLGPRSSAPYKQHIFLAPGTARWIQFYPYVGEYTPPWRLSWQGTEQGTEHGSADLGQPASGPPATILLADPDSPGSRNARMRLYPEGLFPPTVSATDGLHAVVLDHQPRWEAPRREAFLDWVRRGGTLHLLPGLDGAQPQFTGDLSALNVQGERGGVGSGQVIRHRVGRSEITEQFLKDAGFPPPEIVNNQGQIHDVNGFLFRRLASITKPDISWNLIYLLTGLYVILIGPVFYILRRRDYRVLLAGFLVTVATFAWLFTVVGRRGYGEKQIYHSLSIAHSLGGGRFDVQEWVHAFATSGDAYRFEHSAGGQLYAALGEGETVRGEIIVGKDSRFDADIPLFSSRPFLHRGVEKTDAAAFSVQKWEDAGSAPQGQHRQFGTIRIKSDPSVRKLAIVALLERRGNYSELVMTEDGFELAREGSPIPAAEFFGKHQFYDYQHGWAGGPYGDKSALIAQLRGLYPAFISRANNEPAYFRKRLNQRRPADDRARLFVYAEAPPEFGVKSDRFQSGTRLVLYVQDIFKP